MTPIDPSFGRDTRRAAAIRAARFASLWIATVVWVLTAAVVRADEVADPPNDLPNDPPSRLERLSHEREIERLIDDYAWLLDARDFAAYGRLFSHGLWLGPDGSVVARGADEVEASVRRFLGGTNDTFVRHLVTNVRVDLAADARSATATSFLTTLQGTLGGSAVVYRIARYHDRFHWIEGRWWFQSRQELTDWVLKERSAQVAP